MLRRVTDVCLTAVLLLACGASSVDAQDTRAELLERMRAEKAKNLRPHEPGRLEKILLIIDAEDPLNRIAPHNGFFVEYGYSYKPTGSGFGFGGGFRHDLFGRRARVELETGWTYRNYQLVRADVSLPYLARDRAEVGIEATYHHHPQEDFYGLGPASLEDDRVSYLLDDRRLEARGIVRPVRGLELGTRFGLSQPDVGRGTDAAYPSIERQFDDAAAPGLAVQPDFGYVDLFASVDYRDEPGNARTGGYYSATWRRMTDRDSGRYSFDALDARAQQFFPIFDKKRVFAVQARLLTNHADAGREVPFYLRPTLGGHRSVRSFSDLRFRDNAVAYFNLEYRWEAFGILDMALFTDWGTVAPRAADLDFGDLKRAYGIGFRFNTSEAVFFRVDIAAGGGEGLRYLFKFSNVF